MRWFASAFALVMEKEWENCLSYRAVTSTAISLWRLICLENSAKQCSATTVPCSIKHQLSNNA